MLNWASTQLGCVKNAFNEAGNPVTWSCLLGLSGFNAADGMGSGSEIVNDSLY